MIKAVRRSPLVVFVPGLLAAIIAILSYTNSQAQPAGFVDLPGPGLIAFTSYQGPDAAVEAAVQGLTGLDGLWLFDNTSQQFRGYFLNLPAFARGGGFSLRRGQPVILIGSSQGVSLPRPPNATPTATTAPTATATPTSQAMPMPPGGYGY